MTTIKITLTSQDVDVTVCVTAATTRHDEVLAGILDAARGALIMAGFSAALWDEFEWPRAPDPVP